MKLSVSTLLLAAVAAQYDDSERGKSGNGKKSSQPEKGPNFCNGKANQLKANKDGIPQWKCKSRNGKNKGDSKKCKGKCLGGLESTAPKKVRCDEGVGWMTKKRGYANWAAVDASCCMKTHTATCNFSTGEGENGPGTVTGALEIVQYNMCGDGVDRVVFKGKLGGQVDFGFTEGEHGLHVHHGTDITTCSSLAGHMSIGGDEEHGSPRDTPPDRHQGDLGNIRVNAKGVGDVWITDTVVSLDSAHANFIGGRGMVLHALPDQFDQQPTGAAGARVGCCIIENVTAV